MRILILLITSSVLLISCLTKQKEKELPSYFCNENLERYFAGNDSLPIININPNDSFGVIRESVDSLYKLIDINETTPLFNFNVLIDSGHKTISLKGMLFDYDPFEKRYPYFGKRIVFEIRLNIAGQLLIEGELGDTQTVKEFLFKNLNTYRKDLKYAITSLQWDKGVKPEFYNNTIKAIIDGYIDVLKFISQNNYKKPLCELNISEFDSLSKSIPFKLSLGYHETIPSYLIPQPPPIIEDEFLSE